MTNSSMTKQSKWLMNLCRVWTENSTSPCSRPLKHSKGIIFCKSIMWILISFKEGYLRKYQGLMLLNTRKIKILNKLQTLFTPSQVTDCSWKNKVLRWAQIRITARLWLRNLKKLTMKRTRKKFRQRILSLILPFLSFLFWSSQNRIDSSS